MGTKVIGRAENAKDEKTKAQTSKSSDSSNIDRKKKAQVVAELSEGEVLDDDEPTNCKNEHKPHKSGKREMNGMRSRSPAPRSRSPNWRPVFRDHSTWRGNRFNGGGHQRNRTYYRNDVHHRPHLRGRGSRQPHRPYYPEARHNDSGRARSRSRSHSPRSRPPSRSRSSKSPYQSDRNHNHKHENKNGTKHKESAKKINKEDDKPRDVAKPSDLKSSAKESSKSFLDHILEAGANKAKFDEQQPVVVKESEESRKTIAVKIHSFVNTFNNVSTPQEKTDLYAFNSPVREDDQESPANEEQNIAEVNNHQENNETTKPIDMFMEEPSTQVLLPQTNGNIISEIVLTNGNAEESSPSQDECNMESKSDKEGEPKSAEPSPPKEIALSEEDPNAVFKAHSRCIEEHYRSTSNLHFSHHASPNQELAGILPRSIQDMRIRMSQYQESRSKDTIENDYNFFYDFYFHETFRMDVENSRPLNDRENDEDGFFKTLEEREAHAAAFAQYHVVHRGGSYKREDMHTWLHKRGMTLLDSSQYLPKCQPNAKPKEDDGLRKLPVLCGNYNTSSISSDFVRFDLKATTSGRESSSLSSSPSSSSSYTLSMLKVNGDCDASEDVHATMREKRARSPPMPPPPAPPRMTQVLLTKEIALPCGILLPAGSKQTFVHSYKRPV